MKFIFFEATCSGFEKEENSSLIDFDSFSDHFIGERMSLTSFRSVPYNNIAFLSVETNHLFSTEEKLFDLIFLGGNK